MPSDNKEYKDMTEAPIIQTRALDIEDFSNSVIWQDMQNYLEHEIRQIEAIGYSAEATQTNIIQGSGIIVGLRSAQDMVNALLTAAKNQEIANEMEKEDDSGRNSS